MIHLKIYMFYIDEKTADKSMLITSDVYAYYVDISNKKMLLYGITDSKIYKENFINFRSDKFVLVKKDISKNKYKKMKKQYKDYFLKEEHLTHYNNGKKEKIKILLTSFEIDSCKKYWFDNIIDVAMFNIVNPNILTILKNKYKDILKKIYLSDLVNIFIDYDYPNDDDYDIIEEDGSITLSKVIVEDGNNIVYNVDMRPDEFNSFVILFQGTLK